VQLEMKTCSSVQLGMKTCAIGNEDSVYVQYHC
jgi:hypothetical protein